MDTRDRCAWLTVRGETAGRMLLSVFLGSLALPPAGSTTSPGVPLTGVGAANRAERCANQLKQDGPPAARATTEQKLRELQHAIEVKGLRWRAGMTEVAKLYYEGKIKPLSPRMEFKEVPARIEKIEILDDLPSSFDWRDHKGADWTTPVKSQGGCGACWAFAEIGVIEAQFNIFANNPDLDLDLSEQKVFLSVSGSELYRGDYYNMADEACVPYNCVADYIIEAPPCLDIDERMQKIEGWISLKVSDTHSVPEYLKSAVITYGPVEIILGYWALGTPVRIDFYGYTGGIYEPIDTYLPLDTLHAVVLVGYNDDEQYWIIKNSWGTGWGEDGFARLRYNKCDVESNNCGLASVEISSLNLKDSDADGFIDVATGGDDCDDSNPNVHPGKEYQVFYEDSLMDHEWKKLEKIRATSDVTEVFDGTVQRMRFYTVTETSLMMRDDDENGIPDSWKPVTGLKPIFQGAGLGLSWHSIPPAYDNSADGTDQGASAAPLSPTAASTAEPNVGAPLTATCPAKLIPLHPAVRAWPGSESADVRPSHVRPGRSEACSRLRASLERFPRQPPPYHLFAAASATQKPPPPPKPSPPGVPSL